LLKGISPLVAAYRLVRDASATAQADDREA
jgi:hypothetical protein